MISMYDTDINQFNYYRFLKQNNSGKHRFAKYSDIYTYQLAK